MKPGRRIASPKFAVPVVGALIAALLMATDNTAAHATTLTSTTANISVASTTPFQGIGIGESAGGELRLLFDYPEPERTQILDLLFCTHGVTAISGYCTTGIYGVSTQILKVELGGDTNGSQGAESAFLHTQAEFNALNPQSPSAAACNLNDGYEWWLMREAMKRDPYIKISALSWGAPGYIGTGQSQPGNFWTTDMQQYYTDMVSCASINHDAAMQTAGLSGTPVAYVGAWNEVQTYDTSWVSGFPGFMSTHLPTGVATPQVICCDAFNANQVATDIANNPTTFGQAVSVISEHYPNRFGNISAPPAGHVLWDSEDGTFKTSDYTTFDASGFQWPNVAGEVAKLYNNNFIKWGVTSTTEVPLVDAWPDNLAPNTPGQPSQDGAALVANSPWSGNYYVAPGFWVTAHTAQFTRPGWSYLNNVSCFLGTTTSTCGTDANQGSYVTLWDGGSTNTVDGAAGTGNWSTIVETASAGGTQNFTLCPQTGSGLKTPDTLTVVESKSGLNFSTGTLTKAHTSTCFPAKSLDPDASYTFSTLTGRTSATASYYSNAQVVDPAAAALSLPYADSFDPGNAGNSHTCSRDVAGATVTAGEPGCYFFPMEGAFDLAHDSSGNLTDCGSSAAGGSGGNCLIEETPDTHPITWPAWNCPSTGSHQGLYSDTYPCSGSTAPDFYWGQVGDPSWANYRSWVLFNAGSGTVVRMLTNLTDQRGGAYQTQQAFPAGYEVDLDPNSGSWTISKRVFNRTTGDIDNVVVESCSTSCNTWGLTDNSWHNLAMRTVDNADGTVTVSVLIDGVQMGTDWTDDGTTAAQDGSTEAPYTSGPVALGTLFGPVMYDDLTVS